MKMRAKAARSKTRSTVTTATCEGKLRPVRAGDEQRADELADAAKEGEAGEAKELRADEAVPRCRRAAGGAVSGAQEDGPAQGAEEVVRIDDEDGEQQQAPVGSAEARGEAGPVKVRAVELPAKKDNNGDGERPGKDTARGHRAECTGAGGEQGGFASVEFGDHAGDVGAGLAEGWDAVEAVDGGGAGVVGGEREGDVVVVAGEERVEIAGAAVDVLVGEEGVVDAELGGGRGHELHEAAGSGARDGVREAVAFRVDDGGEEFGVDVVDGAGVGEEFVELGRGGLRVGEFGCGRRRRRVGDGFYAEDVAGGDVDVVVVTGAAAEKEADAAGALELVACAVEFGAIAEGNVLSGSGQRRCEEQGCGDKKRGAPEGAEDHQDQPTRGGWTVYDAVGVRWVSTLWAGTGRLTSQQSRLGKQLEASGCGLFQCCDNRGRIAAQCRPVRVGKNH